MKTSTIFTICLIGCLSACQKNEIAVIPETMDRDMCMDKFEALNNHLETAPILDISTQTEWISLPKNDNDYWRIVVKANAKGQVPTQIAYTISSISTIEISVSYQNKMIGSPQTTMAFRSNIRETIDISNVKIGDAIIVKMRNTSSAATCYALSFL